MLQGRGGEINFACTMLRHCEQKMHRNRDAKGTRKSETLDKKGLPVTEAGFKGPTQVFQRQALFPVPPDKRNPQRHFSTGTWGNLLLIGKPPSLCAYVDVQHCSTACPQEG